MLIILALLSESYVKKKFQTAAVECRQVTLSTQNAATVAIMCLGGISEPVYLHWAYLGEPSLHSAVINARASFSFHLLHFSCKVPPKHVLTRTKRPGPNMRDIGKPSRRESSELSSQIISSKFASNKNDCKHSSVMLVLISYQSAPHGLVNTT